MKKEGGKLSLAVILGIVWAVMGGVGIAMGGTAIGLPLIALLIPLGIVLGNEADNEGITESLFEAVSSWFGSRDQTIQRAPTASGISDAERLAQWQERMRQPVDDRALPKS
jgi:hypothetical protein